MSFFNLTTTNTSSTVLNGGSNKPTPFSIDDAFDIPEEEDDFPDPNNSVPARPPPIIRNGRLRLEEDLDDETAAGQDRSNSNGTGSGDGASLIQSGGTDDGGRGYYAGPARPKYWWKHPKIRSNPKVVVAACLLVIIGLGKG